MDRQQVTYSIELWVDPKRVEHIKRALQEALKASKDVEDFGIDVDRHWED